MTPRIRRAREFETIFDGREGRHLPALNLIERRLQLDHNIVDPLDLGELIGLRRNHQRRAQFKPRLAIGRRHEDHGVADRRRLWRAGRRLGCGAAALRANRAGHRRIGNGAKRSGARFQRGLATHDLVELLVELLLVQQLPAGSAIDACAQLSDAVLIGVLHLGLAGDQPRQHIVAEGEVSGGRRRPHAEQGDGANPDPEHHGGETHLLAGVGDDIACRRGRSHRTCTGRRCGERP